MILLIDMLSHIFIEPFSFPFMQRALMASLVLGSCCAVFSCFLILRGWSLMGDAISHSVLPGLALAYVMGLPLIFGALLAGTACATSIGFIKNNSRIKQDTAMGIVFSGMFALGLVLITSIKSDIHLSHILFGDILGLTDLDLHNILYITLPLFMLFIIKWKDLFLYCFDPVYGHNIGLPMRIIHYFMLLCLSLIIVAALQMVGIILVVAMLITPGAIGFIMVKSFPKMIFIAIMAAIFSSLSGIIISYHADISPAPIIVGVQSSLFALALFKKILYSHA